MACEHLCLPSSPNFNPGLCRLCRILKYLLRYYKIPFPFPHPEPGPLVEGKIPVLEMEGVKDLIIAELVHEAIMNPALHPSSVILTTMRDSGIYKDVLNSELKEYKDAVEAIGLKVENLAGK